MHYIFSKTISRSPISKAQLDQIAPETVAVPKQGDQPNGVAQAKLGVRKIAVPEPEDDDNEAGEGDVPAPDPAAAAAPKKPGVVIPFSDRRLDLEWEREFLPNVDRLGTPIDRFMAAQGKLANLYDKMYIVVDMPQATAQAANDEQRQQLGLRPYLCSYSPLDAVDFELDQDGRLLWIRFIEVPANMVGPLDAREDKMRAVMTQNFGWDIGQGRKLPTPAQQKRGGDGLKGPTQYRTYTRDGWFVHLVDGDNVSTVSSGNWPPSLRGEVPVVSLYGDKGARFPFGGASLIQGIITLAQDILNLDSLITEALYQQTLSILVMGRQPVEGDEIVVSEGNVLEVSPGSFPPYYLTPSQAPVVTMEQRIQVLAQDIYRLSKFGGGFGLEPKAVAPTTAAYEFNLTNRALADRAALLEAAELEIHRIWYKWMGRDFRGYVEYPEDFSIQSFQELLAELQQAKLALRSPTLKRELEKRIARRLLASHDESILKTIDEETDFIPDAIESFNGPVWYDALRQEVSQPGSGVPVGPLAEEVRAMGIEPRDLYQPTPQEEAQQQQQQQTRQEDMAFQAHQSQQKQEGAKPPAGGGGGGKRRRKRGKGGKSSSGGQGSGSAAA